jgi:thiol-disulfide isomerase/thioredoxin
MAAAPRTIGSTYDLKSALSSCSKVGNQLQPYGAAAVQADHKAGVQSQRHLWLMLCLMQAVLFFWASWSAPCKHMQQVLEALAKQHGGIAYLQVRGTPSGPRLLANSWTEGNFGICILSSHLQG